MRASHHLLFTFYNVKVKIDKRAQNASAKEVLGKRVDDACENKLHVGRLIEHGLLSENEVACDL